MTASTPDVKELARQAVTRGDWSQVNACAMEIARQAPDSPDAPFLMGLAQKAARKPDVAAHYFSKALSLSAARYDAAIELASQKVVLNRYGEARELLDRYSEDLNTSAQYLDMAGQSYFSMSLYEEAWPLYELAVSLQPDAETLQVHMASCAVYLGKIETAKSIYRKILKRHPKHQQTHYDLAQLERSQDDRHIKQMLKVLRKGAGVAANNVHLFYALGKEYEDLGNWRDAFHYYEKAGDAVKTVADYDVGEDVDLMNKIVETCSAAWLQDAPAMTKVGQTPIFIVGLPRTGTTLTDRILSSHSQVQSAGESQLLQMVLRDGSRAGNQIGITPAQIEIASQRSPATIAEAYIEAIAHRLGDEPYFIEKLPENVLYLGLIAKAWPNAKIVHLRRHPMDSCFAVYKQSFFRFAYSLDDLAEYYLAYDRLSRHWRDMLGSRMLELNYEDLVADQEGQTRWLLDGLGLKFEEACLHFDKNATPVATASSVQVREKMHTRSVDKWKKFEKQLRPLRDKLERGGVIV
ncbi:MAG: sulfotransferase [Proteobacteria bacterium]|nr:sulfotransferase [Pseudomonadota bacterium]